MLATIIGSGAGGSRRSWSGRWSGNEKNPGRGQGWRLWTVLPPSRGRSDSTLGPDNPLAPIVTATATAPSNSIDSVREPSIDLQGEATSPVHLAKEVWRARQLMVILARKEFHVRYRRAAFGLLWAIGLPLLQSAVMAIVFSKVAKIGHAPHYAIFILSGMTAWVYFTAVLTAGSTAVVDGTDISSRVYFPRILMPLVQVVTGLYGFVITLVITLALCPLLGAGLGSSLVILVPGALLLIALTAGFCLVDSALHVYFRDVRYIVTAAVIVWFYVTPIIYPADRRAPRPAQLHQPQPDDRRRRPLPRRAARHVVGASGSRSWCRACGPSACSSSASRLHCRFNRVFADRL